MKLTERTRVWIHRDENSNDLRICGEWMGGESTESFSHEEAEEIFACVRDAIEAKYPNITVNPWADAGAGLLD